MWIDSHTHLQPHGEQPPVDRARVERYVDAARQNGVAAFAITEHIFRFRDAYDLLAGWWDRDPNPSLAAAAHAYWDDHVNLSLRDYVRLIEAAKRDGLPVLLGIEMDWLPGYGDELRRILAPYDWDIVVGAVHWIGAWGFDDDAQLDEWQRRDIDQVYADYGALLTGLARSGLADVLAHPDRPKVFGHRPSNVTPLHRTIVAAAAGAGCAVEVNTNGLRTPPAELYPARPVLEQARAAGLEITLASDAHRPERIGQGFEQARAAAERAGYDRFCSFVARRPVAHPLREAAAPSLA